VAELRALTWQQLTAPAPTPAATTTPPAATPATASTGGRGGGASFSAGPIVEGYFLPLEEMLAVAQRKHNDVPVLAGCNLGEIAAGGGMGGGRQGAAQTREDYQAQARQQYVEAMDDFLKLYPAATDQEVADVRAQITRDRALSGMVLWAKERDRTSNSKAFLYLWDHTLPGPNSERLGAFHTAEVPYVLNTLDMSDRPFTDADRKAADLMSSYWANFARTGNPNGKGLPVWPAVGEKAEVMELGDKNAPVPAASTAERSAFWEKFLMRCLGRDLASQPPRAPIGNRRAAANAGADAGMASQEAHSTGLTPFSSHQSTAICRRASVRNANHADSTPCRRMASLKLRNAPVPRRACRRSSRIFPDSSESANSRMISHS
jgi:carboxylesterase type B